MTMLGDTSVDLEIRFDRVGRNHHVPTLHVRLDHSTSLDDLVDEIRHHVRPHLGSTEYGITVDTKTGTGRIEGGRYGMFTVSERRPS